VWNLSLILIKEHRLRTLQNMVLRTALKPKREEVMGSGETLQGKRIHDLHFSANINRVIEPNSTRSEGGGGMWHI
jgi:hypothetical protein